MKIETERLILRAFTANDNFSLFEYRSDKETNKYQGWTPEQLEDVDTFIAKIPTEFNLPETWYQLAIEEKEGYLIGDIGVHFIGEENLQVELGITLNKMHHGKGYATEALTHIIDFLFCKLGKHRITASVDPSNTSSINMLERLGFRKEAHFVKSLFFKNKWVDDVIFALIEEDWMKKNKNHYRVK